MRKKKVPGSDFCRAVICEAGERFGHGQGHIDLRCLGSKHGIAQIKETGVTLLQLTNGPGDGEYLIGANQDAVFAAFPLFVVAGMRRIEQIHAELSRLAGHRGVGQLRTLAAPGDPLLGGAEVVHGRLGEHDQIKPIADRRQHADHDRRPGAVDDPRVHVVVGEAQRGEAGGDARPGGDQRDRPAPERALPAVLARQERDAAPLDAVAEQSQ